MKNKPLFTCLWLIFIISANNTFAQQEPIELKTITGAYQRIIHLNSDDYLLKKEGPEGYPGSGIEGIYAGDKYLIIWDIVTLQVFDISNYTRLATIKIKYAIRDVVETEGKIYCLSKNDYIFVYDSFEFFNQYEIVTDFNSVPEYKSYLAKHKLSTFPELSKERVRLKKNLDKPEEPAKEQSEQLTVQKEKLEYYASLNGEPVWQRAHIWSLHVVDGKVFVNVDYNYLDFKQDFVSEKDDIITMKDNHHFMVLKEEAIKKGYKFLVNNSLVELSKGYSNKLNSIDIKVTAMNSHDRKMTHFAIPSDMQNGKLLTIIFKGIQDNWIISSAYWDYENNDQYSGVSVLNLNLSTKEIINFKFPDWPLNLPFVTNTSKYYSYKKPYMYALLYNYDLSVDIIKVEVNLP